MRKMAHKGAVMKMARMGAVRKMAHMGAVRKMACLSGVKKMAHLGAVCEKSWVKKRLLHGSNVRLWCLSDSAHLHSNPSIDSATDGDFLNGEKNFRAKGSQNCDPSPEITLISIGFQLEKLAHVHLLVHIFVHRHLHRHVRRQGGTVNHDNRFCRLLSVVTHLLCHVACSFIPTL